MDKRKTLLLYSTVALLLSLGFLYWFLNSTGDRSLSLQGHLPSGIASFKLQREITGTEAFTTVKKSHLGRLKAPREAAIGYYEEGLTIWISRYDSEKAANDEIKRMVSAIGRFGQGFSVPTRLKIDKHFIYRIDYQGSLHYFWARQDMIVYVMPGPLSDADIKELVKDMNQLEK